MQHCATMRSRTVAGLSALRRIDTAKPDADLSAPGFHRECVPVGHRGYLAEVIRACNSREPRRRCQDRYVLLHQSLI
jgi:hypothetical protein